MSNSTHNFILSLPNISVAHGGLISSLEILMWYQNSAPISYKVNILFSPALAVIDSFRERNQHFSYSDIESERGLSTLNQSFLFVLPIKN